jgi:hypothetical protein
MTMFASSSNNSSEAKRNKNSLLSRIKHFGFFRYRTERETLAISMTYLGVPSIATLFSTVFIFLFSFYTPIHVLVLMGYLQVEYTQSLVQANTCINGIA